MLKSISVLIISFSQLKATITESRKMVSACQTIQSRGAKGGAAIFLTAFVHP
jgi:hypothetical protein